MPLVPDNSYSTLTDIIEIVRQLTRTPSESQLSDAQIFKLINQFLLYDFPELIQTFSLKKTFTFYTSAYQDVYKTDDVDPNAPLYNFKNKYTSVHAPVYIGGKKAFFTESREQLFGIFNQTNYLVSVGTGDGVTLAFGGTLSQVPVIRGSVLFSTQDINDDTMKVYDDGNGLLQGDCGLGNIDYVTGVYNFIWNVAPKLNANITAQSNPYIPSRPVAICWFADEFILRPVPDQSYAVNMEVYVRPALLGGDPDPMQADFTDMPELAQWAEFIAYGTARKIFERRTDTDSLQAIMPKFLELERLAMRRKIKKNSNQRVATIYTEMTTFGGGTNNSWEGY